MFGLLLVSYLIFSGKIAEIGGAGLTLRLRQFSAESKVFEIFRGTEIRKLVADSQIVAKSSESDLKNVVVPSLFRDKITALSLKRGENMMHSSCTIIYNTCSSHPTFEISSSSMNRRCSKGEWTPIYYEDS